jgi:hypothetical protein
MVRYWVGCAAIALVAGCGSGSDVHELEATFDAAYLAPLASAGMTTTVLRTCRFADPVDAPWHLLIDVRIDATEDRVADVLTRHDVVVVQGREPMIVQQIFNEPGKGWDGILEKSGDQSMLRLERSYATHSGRKDALGWAEVCADTPPQAPTVP